VARGGVDTATRVLSVRELAEAAKAAREASGEAGDDADAAEERAADSGGDVEATGSGGEADSPAGDASDGSGVADEAGDANGSDVSDGSEDADGSDVSDGSEDADASGDSDASGDASGDRDEAAATGNTRLQDESAATGDGRLRDAVAAWVASADAKAKPKADAEDADEAATGAVEDENEGAESTGAAEGVTDAQAGPEDAQDAVEPVEGGARSDADAEAADVATDAGESPADDAEDAEAADSVDAADSDQVTPTAGKAGTEATAGTASAAGDSTKADATADTDADPETETDPKPKSKSSASPEDTDSDPDAEPAAAADAAVAAEPAATGASAGTGTGTESAPKDASPGKSSATAAEASGKDDTDAEPDGGTPADTSEAAVPDGAKGDADAKDAESADSAEGTAGAEGADSESSVSDKPRVDQPTAVFKAVRPPAPAVDQPTTMLKFGGAAKDPKGGSKGDPKSGSEADADKTGSRKPDPTDKTTPADGKPRTPESPAERTSKFVALKPLDDPSTRKPKAADATAALPQVPSRTPEATSSVPQVGPERTTQQPLPPKPPLDLLAELTNTPPPPDTPVRTAIRRVKIWTPLVLLLAVVFAVAQAVRPLPAPTLDLASEDSYTFEGGKLDIPWPADGQAALDVSGIGTFGSSGEQRPVPIASVAKVMTAYVILRDHPLKSGADGPKIQIDQTAEDQSDAGQESTVHVTKGDSISQREALESILIASANNIARLLARWDAGSEKAFVEKMNKAADDLGMTNTTYTDPSGLNNTTVSTAVDQVKLAKQAMEEPAFREVAAMMRYVDYKGVKHDNWNRLVGYNDVVGIKTGTTTSALGNLVFAAKKEVDGEVRRIVGAVVRQPAGGSDNTIIAGALDAGDKLIRAAQGALKSATILKKGEVVGYVDDGLGGRTPVVATQDVKAVGWAGLTVKLTFAADDLPHTAKAGTKVGSLTVGDGSGSAVKVPVALQKDLVEPGFPDKLTRVG
jgi:D-alanyl-D-alanine carboxypeptidase